MSVHPTTHYNLTKRDAGDLNWDSGENTNWDTVDTLLFGCVQLNPAGQQSGGISISGTVNAGGNAIFGGTGQFGGAITVTAHPSNSAVSNLSTDLLTVNDLLTANNGLTVANNKNTSLTGPVSIGGNVHSQNYTAGLAGWQIDSAGNAEFNGNVIVNTTGYIRTGNFASGVSGWNISGSGDAEFENVRARGELRGSKFVVSEVVASSGTQIWTPKPDALFGANFTTPSAAADTGGSGANDVVTQIKQEQDTTCPVAVGDILWVKSFIVGSGIASSWFEVTVVGTLSATLTNHYPVTLRLRNGSTSVTFTPGTIGANFGTSTGGQWVSVSADSSNPIGDSPNISVVTYTAKPWNSANRQLVGRFGRISNAWGLGASAVYGTGAGAYGVAGASWLTADDTYGIRLGNNLTTKFRLDTTGKATFGDFSGTGGSEVPANSTGRVEIATGVISFIQRGGAGADTTTIQLYATPDANGYVGKFNQPISITLGGIGAFSSFGTGTPGTFASPAGSTGSAKGGRVRINASNDMEIDFWAGNAQALKIEPSGGITIFPASGTNTYSGLVFSGINASTTAIYGTLNNSVWWYSPHESVYTGAINHGADNVNLTGGTTIITRAPGAGTVSNTSTSSVRLQSTYDGAASNASQFGVRVDNVSGSLKQFAYLYGTTGSGNDTAFGFIIGGGTTGGTETRPTTGYMVDVRGKFLAIGLVNNGAATTLMGAGNAQALELRYSNGAVGSYFIGSTFNFTPDLVFSNNATTERARLTDTGILLIGNATALYSAYSKLEVRGGRTWLVANSEQYALALRYSDAAGGQYYLGASNSASPDLYLSNNAGTLSNVFYDGGNVLFGNGAASKELILNQGMYTRWWRTDNANDHGFSLRAGNTALTHTYNVGGGAPGLTGANITAGGVFTSVSDRTKKTLLASVDQDWVVAQFRTMPAPVKFKYRNEQDEPQYHYGWMAQDMYPRFSREFGKDERTLSPIDFQGITATVLQHTLRATDRHEAQIAELRAEVATLRKQVN